MKNLKSILILTTILTLSLTVATSYGLPNQSVSKIKQSEVAKEVTVIAPKQTTTNSTDTKQLHGDVWFAFSAIGVIGAYLAFKK